MKTYSIPPHLRISHTFYRQYVPIIGGNGYLIFSYLLLRRNDKTEQCNPSLDTIVEETYLDKKTVVKYLRLLESLKLIRKHATFNGGKRSSNQYDILVLWNQVRDKVNKFIKTPPPEIPIIAPSLEEVIQAVNNQQQPPAPVSASIMEKQQACTHPEHAWHQPVEDFTFCGLCYAELPVMHEDDQVSLE